MSLIEGVGDEVTDFFIVMTVLFVGWLAWCSTSIADRPLRTVFILRDRAIRIASMRAHLSNLASNLGIQDVGRPRSSEATEEETPETTSSNSESIQSSCPDAAAVDSSELPREASRLTESATTGEEVLIEAMDSFGNADRSVLHKTVKAGNSDVLDQTTTITTTTTTTTTSGSSEYISEESAVNDSNDITIKLKFINDDQKIVTGSLREMLGDFKRKHFQVELEEHKAVRLVFNGRVLQPDTQTLEQCGLFNDCVVHCWVHQPRPATVSSSTMDNSPPIYFNSQPFSDLPTDARISSIHNDWELSWFVVSFITFALGALWYSRYLYAQLFTTTTTFALYALTALFALCLFGHFVLEPDHIRNV